MTTTVVSKTKRDGMKKNVTHCGTLQPPQNAVSLISWQIKQNFVTFFYIPGLAGLTFFLRQQARIILSHSFLTFRSGCDLHQWEKHKPGVDAAKHFQSKVILKKDSPPQQS